MTRLAFIAYALFGALMTASYVMLPKSGIGYDAWYFAVGLSAVAAIVLGVRINLPREARAWYLVALGQLLYVAGDAVALAYSLLGKEIPYPSVADVLSLAGYPAIGTGLFLMIRARSAGRDKASMIDPAIAATGIAFFSWVMLIQPYSGGASLAAHQNTLAALYPLFDVALVVVAVRVLTGAGLRMVASVLLAVAFLAQFAADGVYLLGSVEGWYIDGGGLGVVWLGVYVAWGLAALHPSMTRLTERVAGAEEQLSRRRLAALTVVTFVTPMLMLEQSIATRNLTVFLMVVISTALFGLVIARLAGVVTRHDRAKQREVYLRRATADLVKTKKRSDIYRIAVESSVALSEAGGPTATRAALCLGDAAGVTIVAASGVAVEGLLGQRVTRVPAPVSTALSEGRPGHFTGPAEFGVCGLAAGEQLAIFPLVIQGESRGALWVRADYAHESSLWEGMLTLSAQVALALESVTLGENLLERESERRFRRLVQNSRDVILVLEPDLTIKYSTPSADTVLGHPSETLLGTSLVALLPEGATDGVIDLVAGLAGETVVYELELRRADGTWCAAESIWSDLSDDPEVNGIVVTARDVTERRRLERELTHQAFHDPLTGLANRELFTDRVTHALDRAHRSGEQLAVLFIDLDDFKTVNDSLGHAAGDELLIAVAGRLEECLRNGDTCARLGGDEFGVLLEGVRPSEEAEEVAARIAKALDVPFVMAGGDVYARASVGVALGATATGASELLRHADVAMYRAKTAPGSAVEIFEPGMQEAARHRLELRADLERAVIEDDFHVHYQPIVALATGRVVGLEALVRWQHHERGAMEPAAFVPLAEETGLIGRLGGLVLGRACDVVAGWQQTIHGAERLRISVNISGHQLVDPEFPAEVSAALTRSGLRPEDLMLELTESVLMGDGEAAALHLERLKKLGVRLAIDDFGTGFSSLSYLHRFPVDTLKIAKPFVDRVGRGDNGRLAAAIVSLGDSLHLETIAEGIEDVEQLDALRGQGCSLGQGYYFERPLSEHDTRLYLARRLRSVA